MIMYRLFPFNNDCEKITKTKLVTHYLIADGTQFAPRVSKDAVLYAYSPEICRYDYSVPWRVGHSL